MFKKRSRPQTAVRARSEDNEPQSHTRSATTDPEPLLGDLIAHRKFKKARQGITADKLSAGDGKKKRRNRSDIVEPAGLVSVAPRSLNQVDDEQDLDGEGSKARRAVRSNNFTQQTNTLDVDKHMMEYIEQNLKTTRPNSDKEQVSVRLDPKEELYRITAPIVEKPSTAKTRNDDGSVTNSMTMLTAIPEVDLGMDTRLRNIEETEKAKRVVAEERSKRIDRNRDEEHLVATRFQNPATSKLSDNDLRIGAASKSDKGQELPNWKEETATDEMVLERFKKKMRK